MLVVISAATAGMQETALPSLNAQMPGEAPSGTPGSVPVISPAGNLSSGEVEDLLTWMDAQRFQRDIYRTLAATYLTVPMFRTMAAAADTHLDYGYRLVPEATALEPGVYLRGDLRDLFRASMLAAAGSARRACHSCTDRGDAYHRPPPCHGEGKKPGAAGAVCGRARGIEE